MKRPRKRSVKTFDDFVDEAGMLATFDEDVDFNVTNPLEQYFFDVADKHGILDALLDDDRYDDEP